MKHIERLFIILSTTLLFFLSCSTDSSDLLSDYGEADNPDIVDSEDLEYESQYLLTEEERYIICDYLEKFDGDVEKLTEKLKTEEFLNDAILSIEDSIIYLTTSNNCNIQLDLTPKIPPVGIGKEFFDFLNGEWELMDTMFSFENEDNVEGLVLNPAKELESKSRAISGTVTWRYLNNKKILFFSPDPELRTEDIEVMNSINQILRKDKSLLNDVSIDINKENSCHPSIFNTFNEYDIVYIGCHGSKNGQLFLPYNGMDARSRKEYDKLVRTTDSGVTYAFKVGALESAQTSRETAQGVMLGKKFFDKNIKNLSNTILWASICYGANATSEFRGISELKKSVIDLYGSYGRITYQPIRVLMTSWLARLAKGFDTYNAFDEASAYTDGRSQKGYLKLVNNVSISGIRSPTSPRGTYVRPETLGIRNISRSKNDHSEPLRAGYRLRINSEDEENSNSTFNGGIKLTRIDNNATVLIPMSSENTVLEQERKVTDKFSVKDFSITLPNLEPETFYRYSTYYYDSEGQFIESEKAFEFTSPAVQVEDDVLYIYSAEDYREFIVNIHQKVNGVPKYEKNVKLMADIELDYFPHTHSYDFAGHFDGNGHSIRIFIDEYLFSLYPFPNVSGTIENLTWKVNYENNDLEWSTNGFCEEITSTGILRNCCFSVDGTDGITLVKNNHGLLEYCDFNFTSGYWYEYLIVNNLESGIISHCNLTLNTGGYHFDFIEFNKGVIENCKIDGHLKLEGDFSGFANFNYGNIINCESSLLVTQGEKHGTQFSGIALQNMEGGTINRCFFNGDIYYPDRELSVIVEIEGVKYLHSHFSEFADSDVNGICRENKGLIENTSNKGSFLIDSFPEGIEIEGLTRDNQGIIRNCEVGASISIADSKALKLNCTENASGCNSANAIDGYSIKIYKISRDNSGSITGTEFTGDIVLPSGLCCKIYE